MATQRDAELLVQLLRWGTEMGTEEAYREIFSDEFDKEEASVMNTSVGRLLVYGETVGTLVKRGLLDRDLLNDLWASYVIWERVGPAALRAREDAGDPRIYENFEALAKASPHK
ncbi:MAG: hypothetical protein WB801_06595 [Candidatus Dormiibacterota bacterium]